jgi:hypothetical protein
MVPKPPFFAKVTANNALNWVQIATSKQSEAKRLKMVSDEF